MTALVQEILHSFDQLSENEKREVAFKIIQKTVQFELPPLSDEELIACAEELFLSLDREESANG